MKKCSICKIEKAESDFYKRTSGKSSLRPYCKICANEKNKKWKEKNPERQKTLKKEWIEKNKENYLAKQREYARNNYAKNPEKEKERVKKWKEKNPERYKEIYIKCYKQNLEKNREKARRRSRNWYESNKEKALEYFKQNREKNKNKIKARYTLANALKNGKIMKSLNCDECKIKEKLQAHHHDYSKPLDVIWLCTTCHAKVHSKYFREDVKQ